MLKLYNSLTRKKEIFKPINPQEVKIYTCGPTVYNYAHIGNLRAYVFADILKRTLIYNSYKVKHVINITDVGHLVSDADEGEDKMMRAIRRERLKPTIESMQLLARRYTKAFKQDLADLNIIPPSKYTKATQYIKQMIKLIERLEKNGFTYRTKQAIYFDISRFPEYKNLFLGQRLEEKRIGAREEVKTDPEKKHPADFALWFFLEGRFKNAVQHWPSKWGEGFPGWHIECSAMGIAELGEHFDIHTGGIDHITKHHPNEIAQNRGAVGHQVVNFWMHNEFVIVGRTGRMAKSGETFITLSMVKEKKFDPLAYRYLLLNTHYRQRIDFSWKALEAASYAYKKLIEVVRGYPKPKVGCADFEKKFLEIINDDLAIPRALALMWQLIKSNHPSSSKAKTLLKFDEILGLNLKNYLGKREKIPQNILDLARQRQRAREEKNYSLADEIRDKIKKKGYYIEDIKDGYRIIKE